MDWLLLDAKKKCFWIEKVPLGSGTEGEAGLMLDGDDGVDGDLATLGDEQGIDDVL